MSDEEYVLEGLSDALEAEIRSFQHYNREGSAIRSRLLSLAITDLESAQNWIERARMDESRKHLEEEDE